MTAPRETIQLELTTTAWYSVKLTADEAREMFGLGGTSDRDLPGRITAIVNAGPYSLASEKVQNVLILDHESGHKLTAVNLLDPANPGDQVR
jgi:hypothetical protein